MNCEAMLFLSPANIITILNVVKNRTVEETSDI